METRGAKVTCVIFFNDTRRELKVHPASLIPEKVLPKYYLLKFEVPSGYNAFIKLWDNDTILVTTTDIGND